MMTGCRCLVVLLALWAALAAWAQPEPQSPWQAAMEQGRTAMNNGRYADAIPAFENAIALCAKIPLDDARVSDTYLTLARCHHYNNNRAGADGVVNALLVRYLQTYGLQDARMITLYLALGDYYRNTSGMDAAVQQYQYALSIARKLYGEKDVRLAEIYTKVADAYRNNGRAQDAVALLLQAVALFEAGGDTPGLIPVLTALAAGYSNLSKTAEMQAVYQRLVTLHEKSYGADDERTLNAVSTLFYTLRNAGKVVELQPLLERMVAGNLKRNGLLNAQSQVRELAVLYVQLGQVSKADAMLVKNLDDVLAAGVDTTPAVLNATRTLVDFYLGQERWADAAARGAQLLAAIATAEMDDAAKSFDRARLAIALRAQGNEAELAPLAQQIAATLAEQEKRYRKGQAPHLEPMYAAVGDHATMALSINYSLNARKNPPFRDTAITADLYLKLGDVQLLLQKPADAEKTFRTALEIMEKCTGAEHPGVITPLLKTAQSLLAQQKATEAAALCARALAIADKALPEDRLTARVLRVQADALRNAGKAADAEKAAARAAAIEKAK